MRTRAHIKFIVLSIEDDGIAVNAVEEPWIEIVIGDVEDDGYMRHSEYGPRFIGDINISIESHIFEVQSKLGELAQRLEAEGEDFDLFAAEHEINLLVQRHYPELQARVDSFLSRELASVNINLVS